MGKNAEERLPRNAPSSVSSEPEKVTQTILPEHQENNLGNETAAITQNKDDNADKPCENVNNISNASDEMEIIEETVEIIEEEEEDIDKDKTATIEVEPKQKIEEKIDFDKKETEFNEMKEDIEIMNKNNEEQKEQITILKVNLFI